MCYRTGNYTVCRRVSASFSPEILQAGAVKGLEASHSFRVTCDKNAREPAQQPRIALYKNSQENETLKEKGAGERRRKTTEKQEEKGMGREGEGEKGQLKQEKKKEMQKEEDKKKMTKGQETYSTEGDG